MSAAVVISADPARPGEVGPAGCVAGRPLVLRAIDAARACPSADVVCVHGTDEEALALARGAGVEALAGPTGGSAAPAGRECPAATVTDALRNLPRHGAGPDAVLWMSPSHPLVRARDLEGAIELLGRAETGWVFAAVEPQGTVWSGGPADAQLAPVAGPRHARLYVDTGAFYALRAESDRRDDRRPARGAVPWALNHEDALRARTAADLHAADYVLRQRERDAAVRAIPWPLGAIVFDFDGVFTDNRVFVLEDGREAAVCDRADGWGLSQLRKKLSVPILVLSTEPNPIVRARCEKLRLECIHDVPDKRVVLREWLARRKIDPASVAYVGNDTNDLSCLREVGCPVVVADAYPEVKAVAKVVLRAPGGRGAVREFTELVVAAADLPAE